MHDWILISISFDWKHGKLTMEFSGNKPTSSFFYAENVSDLQVPRNQEWGPSIYVNGMKGPEELGNGLKKVRFEIQSGDVIEVTAENFIFPELGPRIDAGTLPLSKE
jgi:hypothetical protein